MSLECAWVLHNGVGTHTHMYAHTNTHIHAYTHTHTHIHTQTHTHTHTHTHALLTQGHARVNGQIANQFHITFLEISQLATCVVMQPQMNKSL